MESISSISYVQGKVYEAFTDYIANFRKEHEEELEREEKGEEEGELQKYYKHSFEKPGPVLIKGNIHHWDLYYGLCATQNVTTSTYNNMTCDEVTCAICLRKFEDGERVKKLHCGHSFHEECVNIWLKSAGSCPVCRHEIFNMQEISCSLQFHITKSGKHCKNAEICLKTRPRFYHVVDDEDDENVFII